MTNSKAYRIFNKRTLIVEESIHVVFNKSNSSSITKNLDDDEDLLKSRINKIKLNDDKNLKEQSNNHEETVRGPQDLSLPKDWKYAGSHPKELIIRDITQEVRTRSSLRNINNYFTFVSQIEPKFIEETESDLN